MSKTTDADRLGTLEKRVHELGVLLHFVDSMRVKIEKSIGVIDQQLIRTDAGLNLVRRQMASGAAQETAKPAAKPKAKAKTKPKSKAKSRTK